MITDPELFRTVARGLRLNYSAGQPRDAHGRWSSGGGRGSLGGKKGMSGQRPSGSFDDKALKDIKDFYKKSEAASPEYPDHKLGKQVAAEAGIKLSDKNSYGGTAGPGRKISGNISRAGVKSKLEKTGWKHVDSIESPGSGYTDVFDRGPARIVVKGHGGSLKDRDLTYGVKPAGKDKYTSPDEMYAAHSPGAKAAAKKKAKAALKKDAGGKTSQSHAPKSGAMVVKQLADAKKNTTNKKFLQRAAAIEKMAGVDKAKAASMLAKLKANKKHGKYFAIADAGEKSVAKVKSKATKGGMSGKFTMADDGEPKKSWTSLPSGKGRTTPGGRLPSPDSRGKSTPGGSAKDNTDAWLKAIRSSKNTPSKVAARAPSAATKAAAYDVSDWLRAIKKSK